MRKIFYSGSLSLSGFGIYIYSEGKVAGAHKSIDILKVKYSFFQEGKRRVIDASNKKAFF